MHVRTWKTLLWNFRAARQSQSYSYHDTLVSGYSHTMIGPSADSTPDTPPPPGSPGPFLDERMAQVRNVKVGRALVGRNKAILNLHMSLLLSRARRMESSITRLFKSPQVSVVKYGL